MLHAPVRLAPATDEPTQHIVSDVSTAHLHSNRVVHGELPHKRRQTVI